MNTTETPAMIATAYLPAVTRRFSAIMNVDRKLPAGANRYISKTEGPEGLAASWALYTPEAVAAYQKAGAIVVMGR